MKLASLTTLLLAALLASGAQAAPRKVTDAQAPRALTEDGPVQVQWGEPAQFSEIRRSQNRWEAERGNWVQELASHLRKSAQRQLPTGQTLEVTLTDIKLAGDFEPWLGPRMRDVRMLRDIYPPRITLQFARRDADGEVIEQGERQLTDMGYLQRTVMANSQDPLRYEKRLLDDWLRRELKPDPATAGL